MAVFFSIIVPCYNRAEILGATVKLILQQHEEDFELLLVDDGSCDNTLQVAHILAQTDCRIRVLSQHNCERGAARNYGLRQANGQYINYFDCDDDMYPSHLQIVRHYIERHGEVEVIHTGYETMDKDGHTKIQVNNFISSTNDVLIDNNILVCNTVFLRRDVALENLFVEDRRLASAEDWELWLRLASQYKFHSIEECTFYLREHPGRSLNTITAEAVRVRDEMFAELMLANNFFRKRYRQRASYFAANRYTFITLTLALTKNQRIATLKYLFKAVRTDVTVVWRRRFLASVKHLF